MRIELELRLPGDLPVDLGKLHPSDVISMVPREIEKLTVFVAGRPSALGEHFKLTCSEAGVDELVLLGPTRCIVSAGRRMASGRLVIRGEAGPLAGADMLGGELEIFGDASDCLGVAMVGGLLRVHGNAGDWCGAAQPGQAKGMTGGTIIVDGSVGIEAGSAMRRGLLAIGGDAGECAGTHMLAGTIICLGHFGQAAGLGMKRGSLIAGKSGVLLPGFRHAGEADPEWLRIYLASLRTLGMPTPQSWVTQLPARFTGDHLVTGKGEVLVYEIS